MVKDERHVLLSTIKVPKNLKNLVLRLPKAQYDGHLPNDNDFEEQAGYQTPPEDKQADETSMRRKKASLAKHRPANLVSIPDLD